MSESGFAVYLYLSLITHGLSPTIKPKDQLLQIVYDDFNAFDAVIS